MLGYLCYRTQRQETVYPRDIERDFHFTHPTVSGLLQRLETKGYLSSEPSTEDRRCKQILVTMRALEAHQQVLDQLAASEQRLVSNMSPRKLPSSTASWIGSSKISAFPTVRRKRRTSFPGSLMRRSGTPKIAVVNLRIFVKIYFANSGWRLLCGKCGACVVRSLRKFG